PSQPATSSMAALRWRERRRPPWWPSRRRPRRRPRSSAAACRAARDWDATAGARGRSTRTRSTPPSTRRSTSTRSCSVTCRPRGGEYRDTVVDNLRKAGYCALNDGEEIAMKKTNDFSEQYDILSSGGNVLRAYMATCRPAWDAIPPAGDNS